MRQSLFIFTAIIFVFSFSSTSLWADENLKRGLAKAQYMLRQANSEKASVQKNLNAAKDKLASKDKEIASAESDLKKARNQIAKLKDNISLWREEYEALKLKLAEARSELGTSIKHGKLQEARFVIQTDNFDLCLANNAKLYELNQELLDAYSSKSAMDAIKQREPFFGRDAVAIENFVEEQQYRIEDLNLSFNEHALGNPQDEQVVLRKAIDLNDARKSEAEANAVATETAKTTVNNDS